MNAQAVTDRQRRELETVASMIEEVMMHLVIHPTDKRFSEAGGAFVFKGLAGEARMSCGGGVTFVRAPGGAEVYSSRREFVIDDLELSRVVCNRVLSELMTIYKQIVISGL